jgi:hypothetical protein
MQPINQWKELLEYRNLEYHCSNSSAVEIKLFRACVESTLLHNAVSWTLTDTLSRKLDGCYPKLFRYALNYNGAIMSQMVSYTMV